MMYLLKNNLHRPNDERLDVIKILIYLLLAHHIQHCNLASSIVVQRHSASRGSQFAEKNPSIDNQISCNNKNKREWN